MQDALLAKNEILRRECKNILNIATFDSLSFTKLNHNKILKTLLNTSTLFYLISSESKCFINKYPLLKILGESNYFINKYSPINFFINSKYPLVNESLNYKYFTFPVVIATDFF